MIQNLLSLLTGLLAFRIRGGFLGFGSDWFARLTWTASMSAVAALDSSDLSLLATSPGWLLSCFIPLSIWKKGLIQVTSWKTWALSSLRGLLWTLPAGGIMSLLGYPLGYLVAGIGLSQGSIEWIASKIPSPVPNFNRGHELAEAIFGGLIGLSVAVAAQQGVN